MTNNQDKIEALLTDLDNMDRPLNEYFDRIVKPGTGRFKSDLLCIGVIDRSLALTYGFTTLIRTLNFQAAAHLVRLHLDNYLRLSALFLVDDPETFAKYFHEGTKISEMTDRDKKPMTDRYLKEKASLNHQWIDKVYTTTSGYVHLSPQHVMNSVRIVDPEKQLIGYMVGKTDRNVPDKAKIDATECMLEITRCVMDLLEGWCRSKEKVPKPGQGTQS